ncbi:MAG: arylsulfatase [Opitutus sp.]|nr:arylsulfatase [Opitutus sp.]
MKNISSVFALLMAALLAPVLSAADASRPNFVLINIDDLGYREIGAFGSNNKTPALDRMAAEGRKLTSHYAAPVCSPSRAALMTGSYPKRALPIPHVLFPNAAIGLHPDEHTIADVLHAAGYTTAAIGKWHLGDQPEFLPRRQGFDYYFGLPYSNDMGPSEDGTKSDFGKKPNTSQTAKAKTSPQSPKKAAAPVVDDGIGIRAAAQPPLALIENDTVIGRIRAEDQVPLVRRYTEKTISFIRDAQAKDRPFFVYLAHNAVHFPRYPSEKFRGSSPNGLLGDWVQEIDWSVGQVLDALRELKLDHNTFVLFVSDNGGPTQQGANNFPLRGSKGSTLEGGVRVPGLAWWPGKIPAASSTDAITTMMDVLPTFAKLARAPLAADRKIDGVDLWPILTGAPPTPPRDTFLYHRGLLLEAVRSGPWKLHLAKSELYHLTSDLGEATDVSAQNPDVVRRLTAIADASQADLGRDGIGPGVRALGRVAHPKPLIALDGTVRPEVAGAQPRFP